MVGAPHIGAGWDLPGGVGTQIQSVDPPRRTVVISQSTTVADSAMKAGAARSASAIFSSLVGSLLFVMMTARLSSASDGRVAVGPPSRDERRVLVGSVLPGEVPGIEQVELALRQLLVEVLGVGRQCHRVVRSVDDLHWRLDPWQ